MTILLYVGRILPYEPYDYGNRNYIPFKINQAIDLFSKPENKEKIKILVLGDSRVERALNPILLDKKINNSITYNLGISGSEIRAQAFLLEKVLIPKLKPDFLIWDFEYYDLTDMEKTFIDDSDILESPRGLSLAGNFSIKYINEWPVIFALRFSNLFRIRSFIRPKSFDYPDSYYNGNYINGFRNSTESTYQTNETKIKDVNVTANIYVPGIKQYLSAISCLEKSGIDFLIVRGPHTFRHYVPRADMDQYFLIKGEKHLLDLTNNSIFANVSLFYNYNHLNYYGSLIYTELVYNKIIDNELLPKR